MQCPCHSSHQTKRLSFLFAVLVWALFLRMEVEKKGRHMLLYCLLLLGSLSPYVVTQVMSARAIEGAGDLGEQKNYYPPDQSHHGRSSGRSHTPSCPTPSQGGGGSSRAAPSYRPPAPSRGGGGYYNPPSTPTVTTPPTGPVTPSPLVPLVPPSPTTPIYPVFPTPPGVPFDPNSLPFTCDFWRTHPGLIWSLFGYWCNIGQLFGPVATSLFGSNVNVLDALANPRTDGFGALYREGTASLLNSMASRTFLYTPQQVRNAFTAALVSDSAAGAQAQVFKKANEGHNKHS